MLILLLLAAPAPILVPGKFDKALDALVTPLAFTGDTRYRTPPLTVECWARLRGKRGFNVLVSSDDRISSQHWEFRTHSGSGALSLFLPGYEPSLLVSKGNVCDKEWHHLAFTFDGKTVRLYRDGKGVLSRAVMPRKGMKPLDGPLSIGMAIEGSSRIGCDGLIDDVRISRSVRPLRGVPTKPHVVDADTVAGWRFDGDDQVLADPSWTPPPSSVGEAWERKSDPDWVDGRLRKMNTGPAYNGTMRYSFGKESVTVYKAIALKVGDGGVIFDRATLRLAAAWKGGWLTHSDRRFGLLNTPVPAGKLVYSTPAISGWADSHGKFPKADATAPLEGSHFKGHYLHGDHVTLSYRVHGVDVLETLGPARIKGETVLVRWLEVGPAKRPLKLATSLGSAGMPDALVVPASNKTRRLILTYGTSGVRGLVSLNGVGIPDLSGFTRPGPDRWKELVTRGELAKDDGKPYVVDTLTIPYENPYNALFFCTGLDYLPDGRIALCTCHGDVWLVTADEKLDKIRWKRYATGLYHPLGLKVVDGKVVVLERGQLTRLHGKDEAHFYENLCNLWHTGSGEHSYDTCLETDPEGRFYFFKTGDPHLPEGGTLLRVSKDGKKKEIFATGFRHPIGLGMSPTGRVTGADQEGNWMPVTRVDIYQKGGFYGDMRTHHRAVAPRIYDPPLLWLPRNVDNSAGGQAWVPSEAWGWPKGQMLHFSYGRCKAYAILTQKVGSVMQAGAVDLGVKFLSGVCRGRFSPRDGQLYVCGLNGWTTAARRDGCLQRMRRTSAPLPMATGLEALSDGVRVRFARPLGKSAIDPRRWMVEQWDYRWSANYGSKRWSVRREGKEGFDRLEVMKAALEEGGKAVRLTIKDMRTAMQMRIGYDVAFADGKPARGAIHSTVHALAKK